MSKKSKNHPIITLQNATISRADLNCCAQLSKTERRQGTDREKEHTSAHIVIIGTFALTSSEKELVFYTVPFIILTNFTWKDKSTVFVFCFLTFAWQYRSYSGKYWLQFKKWTMSTPNNASPHLFSFVSNSFGLVFHPRFTEDGWLNRLLGYWYDAIPVLQIFILIALWFHTNLTDKRITFTNSAADLQ